MLHKNLRKLRMEYEISAERLAQFMKVKEQDILDWENGDHEPSLKQLQQLAELFDVSLQTLLDENEEKSNHAKKEKGQGRTKTKKKKKTKTTHKTKKVNNKTVEKKRNWPLIVILILLVALGTVAGFLFWKYGDEYSIIKNKEYTASEMVGTFQDETAYEGSSSTLTLGSDGSYTLTYHDCSLETSGYGTWSIEKDVITLTDGSGNAYTIKIHSTNKLKFTGADIGCSPKKNDIFTRGSASKQPDGEEDEQSTSYIQAGQWSGSHTTLRIDEVKNGYAIFTMQSYDPNNAENIAELKNIKGTIQNNTLSFTFRDDGFGHAGEGSIVFDESTAIFNITITKGNEDAPWSIMESGTMSK